jgi:HlyD family secretion protein
MLDKPSHDDDQPRDDPLGGLLSAFEPEGAGRRMPARVATWSWRHRKLLAAVVATLIVAWTAGGRILYGPAVDVLPVIKADFIQSVVASGHVEAPYRVNVASQITGVVADVPVSEGQTVKAGDVLVMLDDREARAAAVQAEGAVAQAEARMRQLRELTLPSAEEGLKQAKATLINAQAAYDRAKRLVDTGSGTRVTLDEATKSLDVAKAALRSAEFQVFTNRPGGSDYVMAETQLRQATAAMATAQSRLSYTVIKAPRDGILISRDVERGNVVQPTNVLMKLSPSGDTQLVVQIDEKNLGLVALGQKALASADAFPKETFPALVDFINPGVDLQRASVEVKLKVPEPPAYLRQDMTVSVDIEAARRPAAIVVAAEALRGMANSKPWVLKISDGRAQRQPVKVGLVSGGKAELLEGLQPGDVVLPAKAATKAGARVRPRAPVDHDK